MKKYFLLIAVLVLPLWCVSGQSLTSAKSDVYKQYVPKYGFPRKIIENNSFYNRSGVVRKKEVVEFSVGLDTIQETRYKEDQLDAQLLFVFNEKKQLIFRSFRNKVPLFGWQQEQSTYIYNKNGLAEIRSIDGKTQLKSVAQVICDSLGHPTSFKLYDGKGNLMGSETGEYHYGTNKWTYQVFNPFGEQVSKQELVIESVKSEKNKYNENGDCILYPRNWDKNDTIYFQVEYKYDDQGNWIEQRIYALEKDGEQLTNKRLDRKFKRKIKYNELSQE